MIDNKFNFWIGTSWKMNKTLSESLAFCHTLAECDNSHYQKIQRFIIPSFTAIRQVKQKLAATSIKVGAQNMHWGDAGAWTGEISPKMLVDCGVDLVELGHSERRKYFGETNATVGLKVVAAVHYGLIPLICIGETLEDKRNGRASEVLQSEIIAAFQHLTPEQKSMPILLAYEPRWAIGETGIAATPAYAEKRHSEISRFAGEILGRRIKCLYGGSVTIKNCDAFISCPHIDGLFIGRAAWDARGYLAILDQVSQII